MKDAQHRNAEPMLDVPRRIERVVEAIEEEREHHRDQERDGESDHDNLCLLGRIHLAGNARGIDQSCNRRLEIAAHARFLQASHEHLVKVAVLLDLALQDTELEFLAIDRLDVVFALAQRALDGRFVCLRHLVFFGHADDHAFDLPSRVLLRRVQLRARLNQLRMLRPITLGGVAELPLGIALLFLQFLNKGVLENRGKGF